MLECASLENSFGTREDAQEIKRRRHRGRRPLSEGLAGGFLPQTGDGRIGQASTPFDAGYQQAFENRSKPHAVARGPML